METKRCVEEENNLDWLLEGENPSVRYWTLVDLLGRDASDRDVLAARSAILEQALVKELFAGQREGRYWGEDESKPYTARGAVGVLSLLHMLGAPLDERIRAGCDSLLKNCQNTSGGFSLVRATRSGIFPCTTGEHLRFLVDFGMGSDERVRAAFDFLVRDMSREDALVCGRYNHQACLWGAIAGLNGLAAMPAELHSDAARRVVDRLANALLEAEYDFEGEHKRWLTFGVPRAWDLLSACKAMAVHGYGKDPRFQRLWALVLAQRDGQDRWMCGSVSRTWPLEKRGQPSKWVTLDGLRVERMLA